MIKLISPSGIHLDTMKEILDRLAIDYEVDEAGGFDISWLGKMIYIRTDSKSLRDYREAIKFKNKEDILLIKAEELLDRTTAWGSILGLCSFLEVTPVKELLLYIPYLDSRVGILASERSLDYRAGVVRDKTLYDIQGAIQFCLLLGHGLRQTDKVLDIGCGSLSLGRLLIIYLQEGNYYGMEPNRWLIEDAIKRELSNEIIERKAPKFSYREDFAFSEAFYDTKFDYVMTHSIFTHAPLWAIKQCVGNLKEVMHKGSLFLGTFRKGTEDNQELIWAYSHRTVAYKPETMQALFLESDLNFEVLNIPHYLNQSWFSASRIGEH